MSPPVRCSLLTTGDTAEWQALLMRLSKTDIYFLPEYHRAYELHGDGTACLFVAEKHHHVYIYPFLQRRIEKVGDHSLSVTLYDISSVYGYTGPLATTDEPRFLRQAQHEFYTWCAQNRIITEFIRFHPLLDNHTLADPHCEVQLNRHTIVLPLHPAEEPLWNGYQSVHRNKVRKAWKNGLICRDISDRNGLNIFRQLYNQTMEALQARAYYNFPDIYYNMLLNIPGERVKIYAVFLDERPLAAGMFMHCNDTVHYHLSGSDIEARTYAPTNLMLHQVAVEAGQAGYQWLHLGGGRTAAPDDSLFTFKKQISNQTIPFYLGRRIIDHQLYQELCALWLNQYRTETPPDFFPLYRAESPDLVE